ncbi:hypothetical protein [Mucilaginibacter sp. UR6-11]|uniref:hypothetical protein n=1 Tax=Mucilaginibacter sp. UR6-11 TaxID=1435644 RepID=UPI001E427F54|nr:hypothetical protein [Mucilaginibacter sp. UR6-11]MCC8424063.1 hypothetical protein [Mucilaginibacter sp. UR6-11]
MVNKYLYLFIITGVVLLILGLYKLITEGHFSAGVIGDVVPACFLFYLAYKSYKTKKDDELM